MASFWGNAGWEVVLRKYSGKRLDAAANQKAVRQLADRLCRPEDGLKVAVLPVRDPVEEREGGTLRLKYLARMTVKSDRRPEDVQPLVDEVEAELRRQAKKLSWEVLRVRPSHRSHGAREDERADARPPFVPGELTTEVTDSYFQGVFEREPHIRLLHDTVKGFADSKRVRRSHTLLYGKPAGCKTTLFERFKQWYESGLGPKDPERVAFIDGPTMSKAGLEKWLLEQAGMGRLPEILVIEEVEKQNLDNALVLLSVMGSGYVSRTNAHVKAKYDCRILVWATCNDEQMLRQFRNGALWSRFTHRLYCQRPTKELMRKILLREVDQMGGDERWADRALKLADELQLDDPRQIIGLLDGRSRLLDGSFRNDLLAVAATERADHPSP